MGFQLSGDQYLIHQIDFSPLLLAIAVMPASALSLEVEVFTVWRLNYKCGKVRGHGGCYYGCGCGRVWFLNSASGSHVPHLPTS
jgi:hypothetical protein